MRVVSGLSAPERWLRTILADVRRDDTTTLEPAKHPDERFELYSIPAHETGKPEVVQGRNIGSAKRTISPNTVLLSKINPRLNRVWVVGDSSGLRQIGSSEWIAFCPIEGVVPQYLAHYLRQDRFCTYLASNVSGVGGSLMRVRAAVVDPYPFALPSTGEQQRIVGSLDSYLTRLDDAVASLDRVQSKLKACRASVLKAAVEGRLVPNEASLARAEKRYYEPAEALLARILMERRRRWEEAELARLGGGKKAPEGDRWKSRYQEPAGPDSSQLSELPEGWCWASVDQLTDGARNSGYGVLVPGSDVPEGVPLVRVGDMHDGTVSTSELKRIDRRIADQFAKTYLRGGEVLLSLVGTIGRSAVVPTSLSGANVARAVGVLPISSLVRAHWVEIWFRSPKIQALMNNRAHEVARKTLNLEDVRAAAVALPPAGEQDRIIAEAEDLESVASATALTVAADSVRCGRLRQAVLRWAFEGKLVDQDPTDEPAEKLLARIRAERAAVSPVRKSLDRGARGAA